MTEKGNKLSQFLIDRAKAEWEAHKQDYHLARIHSDFKDAYDEDYKQYLEEHEKISEFARGVPDLHVNQDPRALARIGVRPIEAKDDVAKLAHDIRPERVHRINKPEYNSRERSLIYFLRLLSELPENELQKIDIPTSALVKLVKK